MQSRGNRAAPAFRAPISPHEPIPQYPIDNPPMKNFMRRRSPAQLESLWGPSHRPRRRGGRFMPVQPRRWWRRGWILALGGALAGWLPPASAQSPAPPVPAPTAGPSAAAPAEASPEQFAERLRKLEEMNQQLIQKYESVSRENKSISNQNAALSKTVQDLSKRLEEASQAQRQQAQARTAGGRAGTAEEPPITG